MDNKLKENIRNIRRRIISASDRAGRNAGEIKLIAVTKYVQDDKIIEAIKEGINDIGESRIQEAEKKYSNLKFPIEWHMIGHLQTNKIKKAVEIFDWIHSIDSLHLAEELNSKLLSANKKMKVLLEVNVSGEESKYGITPEDLKELANNIYNLPQLELKGLMTMAPISDNPENARPYFKKLRTLLTDLENCIGKKIEYLSMGMTDDFEVAIEEGANIVRIGRGIFG
ncbi:MAG: YggS family pyridoxal phosphate-dependent enzyme [bacterium]|nr:YggS family pyridoxal phosphate-dependent enzyme [bacterium]